MAAAAPKPDTAGHPRRAWAFLAWTFGIGWGLALLVRIVLGPAPAALEGAPPSLALQSPPMAYALLGLLFLVLPALVAVVLARRWRVPLGRYGLPGRSPGAALWLAPLLALGLTGIATLLPVAAGMGRLDRGGTGQVQRLGQAGRFVEALELKLDLEERRAPLLHEVATGLLVGVTIGLLLALGTELGWRGLLDAELGHLGRAWSGLACGVIAAAWWAPVLPMAVAAGDTDWPGAALRLASYALLGIVLSWSRAATGSVLTPAALVATWAALGDVPLMAIDGGTPLQIEACRLIAIVLAVVLLLHSRAPPREDRAGVVVNCGGGGDTP